MTDLIDIQSLDEEALRALLLELPKTDLHCHLDGSVRVETIGELLRDPATVQLADKLDYQLPHWETLDDLKALLVPPLDCPSLVEYLRGFDIICGVLQSPENLERVAYEMALDAAAEGVRYLEVRFAPLRHVNHLMSGIDVLRAVDRGLARAEAEAPRPIKTAIIACAMRHFAKEIGDFYRRMRDLFVYTPARELGPFVSLEVARLAIQAHSEEGLARVVGFDLAGPEANYPPSKHRQAFYEVINALMNITVHAGEAYGPESIQEAVTYLNAHRIGHGTRILEDDNRLAHYIRDKRIAVEVCLTSNLQTKAVQTLEQHPLRQLLDEHVRVAICTDNRLVSDTTVTRELLLACKAFRLTTHDLYHLTLNGFKAAFLRFEERVELLLEAKNRLKDARLAKFGTY